jgi:hypothetical protein
MDRQARNYVTAVSTRVSEGLSRRVDALQRRGHDAAALGDPDEVAARWSLAT